MQMAKGNVGSLLVFDPSKIDIASEQQVKSAAGDAVVGIVTERGLINKPSPCCTCTHPFACWHLHVDVTVCL